MASKQYNSPMKMYSEDIIEEIMTQGTAFGKEIDPSNPWNMTGKQFDAAKSGVLAAMHDVRTEGGWRVEKSVITQCAKVQYFCKLHIWNLLA